MVGSILPARLENVEVRRKSLRLLGPVSFTLVEHGITVIMGPNGAGKSTLLRALHGMERLSAGAIRWATDQQTAQQRQAFVFQTPTLMRRTVLDNVAYPLRLAGHTRKAARGKALALLSNVGLAERADVRASVLSGGERQKMALVRALARAPEVLFLDEACANLDGSATRDIEAILQAQAQQGTRLILTTHDIGQARRLADDVLFLHRGKLVEAGPAAAFFDAPQSRAARAYLNGDIVE
ncbi:ATP-binding cassette domain-containing protein [Cognatishimia sp. SS12]|uniref:ATP-binding cassette domain-containing protein n=1 Tax=Cognatishimia sp. SS12 TaxID=2979465 RepID=UPI00233104EF|nr:ATP-binding cassette domain-containing protein [Cognatishimia sp. SS12]MDC0739484.1 ATP-binding cassette domain-containing protein [Cognatishimia sp. SS12]